MALGFGNVLTRSLLGTLVFLCAAPSLVAQSNSKDQTAQGAIDQPLRLSTRIVLLDMTVTDKKGNVINNLTKDDITVYEDKVPQTIRSFEPPTAHVMPRTDIALVNSSADLGKIGNAPTTVLVLDELNTAFSDMTYSRDCIEKYLNQQPAVMPQPTILLVATNTNFEVIHDYTQDREVLRAALKKHFPEYPWKMMKGGANSGGAAERMSLSLAALYQIAKASSGIPGRKTVIWVGAGFPNLDVLQLSASVADKVQNAMKRLTDQLLDSHVTLFTIDPTVNLTTVNGMETPEDLQFAEDNADGTPFTDQVKFSTLAPATGGTALFSRNDIDKEVGTAITQGANYYTLSYSPTNKSNDVFTYRSIRIFPKNPNYVIVTRDGYYPRISDGPNPFEDPKASPSELKADLNEDMTNAALSSMVFSGVPVTAQRDGPGKFTLKIPLKGLNWTEPTPAQPVTDQPASQPVTRQAEISVVVVAFNAKQKNLGHFGTELYARISADPRQHGDALASFSVPWTAPPNTTRIRFVVRDAVTGKIGTVEIACP